MRILGVRRVLCLAVALLPGCTLIDQTTFNPNAGRRPTFAAPAAPAPPPPGPPALLTVGMTNPGEYRTTIAGAVKLARARRPGVEFDVVELVPADAAPGQAVGADAAEVARTIEAQGVPARRIHLRAHPEPNAPPRTVRVYVR